MTEVVPASGENAKEASLDRQSLFAFFEDDREMVNRLATMFLCEYPNLLRDIRSAIEQQDWQAMAHRTHTLKGIVCTVFAHRAVEQIDCLEQTQQQSDDAGALKCLIRLEREMDDLQLELEQILKETA